MASYSKEMDKIGKDGLKKRIFRCLDILWHAIIEDEIKFAKYSDAVNYIE